MWWTWPRAHAAVLPLFEKGFTGAKVYNLGTGKGYSVLDMIHAFSKGGGEGHPLCYRPPASRRHPGVLRRLLQGLRGAGLEGGEDSGRHVRRLPALAKDESQWL